MKHLHNEHRRPDAGDDDLVEAIRKLCAPMAPIDTGVTPSLEPLSGIRAVFFDVYGTLLTSGSGDIGTARHAGQCAHLRAALAGSGITATGPGADAEGLELFHAGIERRHACRRRRGIDVPEIDIVEVWDEVLARLSERAMICRTTERTVAARRLAVEYECRTNPVWPMPGAAHMLGTLARRGLILGIVSNAQFMTPLLFQALLGGTPEQLGFDARMCIWSWRHGRAKPSTALHEKAAAALNAVCAVAPQEAVYVGNDMLNDIFTAERVGFRTALFAGDQRSLRLRTGDERCVLRPDLTLSTLEQLPAALR